MQRKHWKRGLGASGLAALALAALGGRSLELGPRLAELAAALAAPAPLTPEQREQLVRTRFELAVKPSLMVENALVADYFDLPEFIAYSAAGEPIFHSLGYAQDFRGALFELLGGGAPLDDVPPLAELARQWQRADGSGFDVSALAGAELVLVEYWADWCVPCKLQAQEVEAFRAEHASQRRIALLRIERDPKRLDLEHIPAPAAPGAN